MTLKSSDSWRWPPSWIFSNTSWSSNTCSLAHHRSSTGERCEEHMCCELPHKLTLGLPGFQGRPSRPLQTDLKHSNKWENDCLWCETISLSSACGTCVYVAALWASEAIVPDEKIWFTLRNVWCPWKFSYIHTVCNMWHNSLYDLLSLLHYVSYSVCEKEVT